MNKIVYVEREVTLLGFRDKAALFEIDEDEVWVPRTVISFQSDRLINEDNLATTFTVKIAQWWADKELK